MPSGLISICVGVDALMHEDLRSFLPLALRAGLDRLWDYHTCQVVYISRVTVWACRSWGIQVVSTCRYVIVWFASSSSEFFSLKLARLVSIRNVPLRLLSYIAWLRANQFLQVWAELSSCQLIVDLDASLFLVLLFGLLALSLGCKVLYLAKESLTSFVIKWGHSTCKYLSCANRVRSWSIRRQLQVLNPILQQRSLCNITLRIDWWKSTTPILWIKEHVRRPQRCKWSGLWSLALSTFNFSSHGQQLLSIIIVFTLTVEIRYQLFDILFVLFHLLNHWLLILFS